MRCERCFYFDLRLGVRRPPGYPFNLNIAVDSLLKKEFDVHRINKTIHPYCLENNINAIPFHHEDIDKWRNSLHYGISYDVPGTNFKFRGGIDDVWIDLDTKELIIVDYKATSKSCAVSLDADWQQGYKRQIEMYQWLFRKNGFKISNKSIFVYCNGNSKVSCFDKKLNFEVSVLPYNGNDSWVEEALHDAYNCLQSDKIPLFIDSCEYCDYLQTMNKYLIV